MRPVTANVSNTVGLVPGSVAGAIGYRHELAGQRRPGIPLATASVARRHRRRDPAAQPARVGLQGDRARLHRDRARADRAPAAPVARAGSATAAPTAARARSSAPLPRSRRSPAAIYGGYFGAAQGILLLAILGLSLPGEHLQRINALKVVLAGLVNLVAGIVFVFAAHVAWLAALLIAFGSTIGGVLGARYGRRLPAAALRAVIVVVGIVAIVRLL